MIDHIILTVSDVKRSLTFYEAALKPLNIKFFMPYKGEDGHPDLWGFGDGQRAFFWVKQGKPDPATIHWGFVAEDKDKVDEFYEAAMSAGARDNISPRARLEYYPGYYAAERPGKTGGREGGEADLGLLCSPETLSRWHPSMDAEAEAIQSSPRFFLVPFNCLEGFGGLSTAVFGRSSGQCFPSKVHSTSVVRLNEL